MIEKSKNCNKKITKKEIIKIASKAVIVTVWAILAWLSYFEDNPEEKARINKIRNAISADVISILIK